MKDNQPAPGGYSSRAQKSEATDRRKASKSRVVRERKLPRRLRGEPFDLIHSIHTRHCGISYSELLRHYCPCADEAKPSSHHPLQSNRSLDSHQQRLQDVATPPASVAAFCCAVLGRLIPRNGWGSGDDGDRNRVSFMSSVASFIARRRYESCSLQDVVKGFKASHNFAAAYEMTLTRISWQAYLG